MICPCKSRIDCGGDDNPFVGFNSAATDCCVKIGVQYGIGGQLPALGSNWVNSNCVAFADACDQDTADSKALFDYMHCVALNNRTPPAFDFVDPPDVPTPWDVDVFGNDVQTCSALCPDGLLFSFTVKADQFFALSQIQADTMAHSFACKQLVLNQVCMGSLIPVECCLSSTYSATISATGTFTPFTFSLVSGAIPPGMTLAQVSASAAKLSGNPSLAGTFNFSIQATDSHGNFMRKAYTLNVISVSTGAIPTATVGSAYSFNLTVGGNLSAAAVWTIVSGSLPAGLTMDSHGSIVGTPTVAGSSNFTVQVSDGTVTCSKAFTMNSQASAPPIACIALTGSINVGAPDVISAPSRDAANQRLLAYDSGTPQLTFVNTQTNAVIVNDLLPANLSFDQGCFATSVSKFYVTSTNNLRVYSKDGAFITNIVLTGNATMNPIYSPTDDRVYILTDKDTPFNTLTTINPNTNTVVTNTNTGLGFLFIAPAFWVSNTNSIALNDGTRWNIRTLPALALLGQINEAPGGTAGSFCFDSATSKFFVGAFNGVTFDAEVWEVNSTTFVVEHVYVMPNTGNAIAFLEFNPVNGAVIGTSNGGQLAVLNPVTHTVVCELENGDSGGSLCIDYVTGKVYKGRFDANTLSIFS